MSYFPRVLRADKQTQSSHRAVYLRVLIEQHGNMSYQYLMETLNCMIINLS